jgi:hypothetical protein
MLMRVHALLKACCAGTLLAALAPGIASRAGNTPCEAPMIEVAPRPGGQVQFNIQSPCRKGELAVGRYSEVVIMERLDASGNLTFQLDCFLGDREVALIFADDWRTTKHVCPATEHSLTKVAIVWQDRVDLDLHAFEYAALPGSAYDRSARNPGSYAAAQAEYLQSGRSHGFISTMSDGQRLGHNVEVYTLLRHPAEPRGLIAMAVGLGAHNDAADAGSCNSREPVRVDLDVYVLERGSRLRIYQRTFAAPPCGAPSRFITNLVPYIVLGGAGGERNEP